MDSEMPPPDDPAPSTSATPAPIATAPSAATTTATPPPPRTQPTNPTAATTNININHANTTNINTAGGNAPATNQQQTTSPRQQNIPPARQSAPREPATAPRADNASPAVGEEIIFNVPNIELAKGASTEEYKAHVRELHAKMTGGESDDYVETKVALPRSLQGLRTGQVVAKILALNAKIDVSVWSEVMADVVGNGLVLVTVTAGGKELINKLIELKVEPGRTVKVPQATKPNNLYYVECLLPYEREIHVEFMMAFLKKFPTAQQISMPGKKAFGTTRRIRLYFHASTAPREVFTSEDPNIPIREITLPCGSAAQVIHKWQ